MTPRLVLFDIDGTLLSAGLVFRQVLAEVLIETFGTAGPMESYAFAGRTDPEIVRDLMSGAGVDAAVIDANMRTVLDRFAIKLVSTLRSDMVRPKPGIPALVEGLAARKDVTLALLTGNLEPCARAKLAPLGLNAYFPFGAFGSDHEQRSELPAIAVERAYRATGQRFAGKSVIIVGDTIFDVRCGRGLGVRSVAVAASATPRAALAAEQPDALLDSFSDVEAAITAILG
jgi:phosphoglycolate phosphatase